MSYLPAPNDTEFELPPAGTHMATCYRVIDLGTQKTTFQGQDKTQHKVLISWELPEEQMKDGRPFTISQRYTWSMSEKATLRKHLEGWRGVAFNEKDFGPNGFHVKNIIGKPCLLTVTHTAKGDKTYANIAAIGKLMKGMQGTPLNNPGVYLWIDSEGWDSETFHKLSANLQGVIMGSPEYRSMMNGHDDDPGHMPDAGDWQESGDPIPF